MRERPKCLQPGHLNTFADSCCKEIKIFMQTGRDLEMRKMINKKKYWQSWQRRMG